MARGATRLAAQRRRGAQGFEILSREIPEYLFLGSASVTVINEDRGSMGDAIRMLRGSISTNPVVVSFIGSIQDANGPHPINRTVTAQLAVNAWTRLPIASGLRGPGRITLDATNESPHYTGVVVGVIRTATS
jgi:hypothetical protein